LTATLVSACAPVAAEPVSPSGPVAASARADDALFRGDGKWVGGDAAYSIDLGEDRTLWLFQDSLVSKAGKGTRESVVMIRNSVAVQRGGEPASASMRFAWRTRADGAPASYLPEEDERWTWPLHGVRLRGGQMVVFLSVMQKAPGRPNFDFAPHGVRVGIVDEPVGEPASWRWRQADVPPLPFDAVLGGAVLEEGGDLVVLATRFGGTHVGYLARLRTGDLLAGRAEPRFWTGSSWVPVAALGGQPPAVVLDDAGAECSIHRDSARGRFVHVASRGFGATTIAVRFAPDVTGPWSPPVDVFRPPESSRPHVLVYAAKAHPHLARAAGALVVTYATNHDDFWALFRPEGKDLYWPRFVRVDIGAR
jgi:hypothetical protein